MTVRMSAASLEKFHTSITAPSDPTGDTVSFAFAAPGAVPSSFTAGTWHADGWVSGVAVAVTPTVGFTGSGASVELAAGTYLAWVKVADSPEVPVRDVGEFTVY